MKNIKITDMTLVRGSKNLSFKEKIEIIRQLDRLNVDVIELPEIINITADSLLVRTVSAFVKNSIISVSAGMSKDGIENAISALSAAKNSRIKISFPVSAIQMEYVCHKKANKMLELAKELFAFATEKCADVEFFAEDATRADFDFLKSVIDLAVESGVKTVTLCDDEGAMLPDEFAEFLVTVTAKIPSVSNVNLGVLCKNTNGMATASALMAMKSGVSEIKCLIGADELPKINVLANVINQNGDRIGVSSKINYSELQRIVKQIKWINGSNEAKSFVGAEIESNNIVSQFGLNDSIENITNAVKALGYDLSDDDYKKVYDEFLRVAESKTVDADELDAIVASVALQVPPTYKLISYVINNGNIISASAQIKLEKNGKELSGICIGDGPIDASFRTLEQIIGQHFELDDFQIHSVTKGREAIGTAVVKLRYNGKLYSGNGVSTDIIGSSIRAYINAVNKIVYEEA